MGLKKNLSRVLSMVMSGVMCLSLVSPAFAATTATAAATTSPVSTSTSNLHQVKESFLDAYDGSKLANDATYSVTHEEKNPQKIEGYSYRDYSEEVQQIYTHKDLPYIQGYPDKTVRPERYLSRCEAVAIFYRLYDGEYPSSINTGMTDKTFSDVPANAWYYNELSKMYQIGLVNGDGGRFRPNDPITRAELTALATRFNAEKFGKPSASFNDVTSSSWYYNSVSVAEANGWVSGYPDGTFRPDNYISRAETMTIINRTINRSVTIDRLNHLHVANPYIDISENHWAYTQVIEASIRHSGKDWHGLNYNGGVYNIIVEKFVDDNGKEIAPAVTSNARNEFTGSDIKNFPPYENIGYIRILTYSYTKGDALPTITKTADKNTVKSGDILTYTIKVANGAAAVGPFESVVVSDQLPEALTFNDNTVYVDGTSSTYTYENGKLSVNIGDIAPGATKTVVFQTTVKSGYDGTKIENVAVATGKNGDVSDVSYSSSASSNVDTPETPAGGGGGGGAPVIVEKGKAQPFATKTADKATVSVGDTVTYTVKVGNQSTAEYKVENAVLTDVIPAELNFVGGSVYVNDNSKDYSYNKTTRTLTVNLGDLAVGSSLDVQFSATVADNAYDKTVKNVAVLKGDNISDVTAPDQINAGAGVKVNDGTLIPSITKTVNKTDAAVGDTLVYNVVVSNDAAATGVMKNVTLSDVIPEGMLFAGNVRVGLTSVVHDYDDATNTLTIALGDLAPGKSASVKFDVKVTAEAYGKEIENVAVATADSMDPIQAKAPVVTIDSGSILLFATKTPDKTEVNPGDTVTYTVSVGNNASANSAVLNAVMTDTLPEGMTFVKNTVSIGDQPTINYKYNSTSKTLTVPVGDLAPGATVDVTFDVTIDNDTYGQTLNNVAVLSGDNIDDVNAPDELGVKVNDGLTALTAEKVASKSPVSVGETYTYTITVSNGKDAQTTAKNVVLSDVMHEGLTFAGKLFVNNVAVAYTFDNETETLTIPVGDLAPNTSATVKFDVVVENGMYGETIKNVAVASADNAVPVEAPDQINSGDGVKVNDGAVKPSVTKSANKDAVKVGDQIIYTVRVENGEDAEVAMTGITMTDVLPDEVSYVFGSQRISDNCTRCNFNDASKTLTLTVDKLEPGEFAEFQFAVTVNDDAYGKTIKNVAVVDGDNFGPIEAPDTTNSGEGIPVADGETALTAEKVASVGTVNVGETYTYSITVKNESSAQTAAKNVVFSDPLPEGLIFAGKLFVDETAVPYRYTSANSTLTVELGDLEPGASKTISFDVTVDNNMYNTSIMNVATVDADNSDPVEAPETTNGDTGVDVNDGVALPAISKTANTINAKYDDIIVYSVVVSNAINAQVPVRNAVITDVIPEGLEFMNGSVRLDDTGANDFNYNDETKTLTINAGDIAPGESKNYEFSCRVREAFGQEIYNEATLDGDNIDPITGKTVDPIDVAEGAVSTSLLKTADKSTAEVGDVINYTVTYSNDAASQDAARNAVMTDVIPNGLDFQFGSVRINNMVTTNYSFDSATNTLSVNLGDVAPGQSVNIDFAVRVNSNAYGEKIVNVATVDAENTDPVEAEEIGGGVIIGDGATVPEIVKTASKTEAEVGDVITYTVTASNKNTADVAIKNAHMVDILPEYLDFTGGVTVNGQAANYEFDPATRTIDVDLGDLAPGASAKIMYQASINKNAYGLVVENFATLTGDNTEPVQDVAAVQVEDGTTDLQITKQVNSKQVSVGDELVYTITVKNGPAATVNLYNIEVTDALPEFVTFQSLYVDGYSNQVFSYNNGEIGLNFLTLAPNTSHVIEIHALVNTSAYGQEFTNTAVATADDAGTVQDSDKNNAPTNGPGAAGDPVKVADGEPIINASKVADKNEVAEGDTVTYTVTFSNRSNATAAYTNVPYDVIPEGMDYAGNVRRDGRSTNDFEYDTASKTLYFKFDNLEPGETTVYKFDVVVNKYATQDNLVNKLYVPNGNDDNAPVVIVPENVTPTLKDTNPNPRVSKVANKTEVVPGERYTYTVRVQNVAGDGVGTWRHVMFRDTLPAEVNFADNNVIVNGYSEVTFQDGNMIECDLGDIAPGQEKVIVYDVQVKASAKSGTKLINGVTITGKNGTVSAQDDNVIVKDSTWNEKDPKISKTVNTTSINLLNNRNATFTVTLTNPESSTETWKDVVVTDQLDDSAILIYDTMKIDNVRVTNFTYTPVSNSALQDLIIPVGDIAPGQTKTLVFTVEFGSNAQGKTFTNIASASSSSHDTISAMAPTITFSGNNIPPEIPVGPLHVQLFTGSTGSYFMPNVAAYGTPGTTSGYEKEEAMVTPGDIAVTLFRALSLQQRMDLVNSKGGGLANVDSQRDISPTYNLGWVNQQTTKAMVAIGGLADKDRDVAAWYDNQTSSQWADGQFCTFLNRYASTPGNIIASPASRDQIGKMLNAMGITGRAAGCNYTNKDFSVVTSRLQWAEELCEIFGRDKNPDTSTFLKNASLNSFKDSSAIPSSKNGIVTEVANRHTYVKDSSGHEYWTSVDNSPLSYSLFQQN